MKAVSSGGDKENVEGMRRGTKGAKELDTASGMPAEEIPRRESGDVSAEKSQARRLQKQVAGVDAAAQKEALN